MTHEELLAKKKEFVGFDFEDQTECLEAVKEDGRALEYVKKQTPEICLEAVSENGFSLRYVVERTEDICLAAVNKQLGSVAFVPRKILKKIADQI